MCRLRGRSATSDASSQSHTVMSGPHRHHGSWRRSGERGPRIHQVATALKQVCPMIRCLGLVAQRVRQALANRLRSIKSFVPGIIRDNSGIPGMPTLGGANDLYGSGDSIGPCPRSPDPRSAVRGRVSRERPPRTTKPGLRDDLRDTARDLASAASRVPGAFPVTAESAPHTTRKRR